MIDIGSDEFITKRKVFKADILDVFSEYQIYQHYLGVKVSVEKNYNSPIRKTNNNDNCPSFTLFRGRDCLFFKDFGGTGASGDVFQLVNLMYDLGSYAKSLEKVYDDLNIGNYYSQNPIKLQSKKQQIQFKKRTKSKLQVSCRNWKKYDIEFWWKYGIYFNTLKKFNVFPIKYIFTENNQFPTSKYAYGYLEYKDKKYSWKTYQPYNKKGKKFLTNHNYSVHQGYTNLPPTGDILIITKSLKDIMSIYDIMGIPSIAVQAETVKIKQSVIKEYKKRFKHIYILFDNDPVGIINAISYKKLYNIDIIFTPNNKLKDFSDMVKSIGVRETKYYFKNILGV